MKVKFVKNYLTYKSGTEVELEAADAKELVEKGYAEEVKSDVVAETVNAISAQVAQIAEKAAEEAAVKTVEKINKGLASKRAEIRVHERIEDDPQRGFKSFGDFASAIRNGDFEQKSSGVVVSKATGASVGTDADGGYAVPDVWAQEIYTDIVSGADLFGRTFNIPMSGPGSTFKLPADNVTTLGTNGVSAAWISRAADGTAITPSKNALREVSVDVHKVAFLAPVTEELLADAIGLGSYLQKKASLEMSYRINNAILRGDGTGKPTGIIGHAATVDVIRTSSGEVRFNDIKAMWARRYGRPGSFVWIINQEVEAQLLGVEDTSGRNLYFAPGTLGSNPSGVMLGAPVLVSEHASTLGLAGDIVLASLENYITVTKGGVQQAVSPHLYFNKDEQAFRFIFRMGGRPIRDAVITPASGQGTATLSPFVQLSDEYGA